jgi:hypothetical protein
VYSKENYSNDDCQQNLVSLLQLENDTALGQSDAMWLKDSCDSLTVTMQHISNGQADLTLYADELGHVNESLSMAKGSVKLIESEVSILSYMKRWREVAPVTCSRTASL